VPFSRYLPNAFDCLLGPVASFNGHSTLCGNLQFSHKYVITAIQVVPFNSISELPNYRHH